LSSCVVCTARKVIPRCSGLPPLLPLPVSSLSPKPQAAMGVKRGLGMGGPLRIFSASLMASFSLSVIGSLPAEASVPLFWTSMGMSLCSSQIFCVSRSITRRRSREVAVARVNATLTALAIMVAAPWRRADGSCPEPATATPVTSAMIAMTTKISMSVRPRLLARLLRISAARGAYLPVPLVSAGGTRMSSSVPSL
jgi:hypothetical protein